MLVHDLSEGPRRFSDLERALPGISPRTLSDRLRVLEQDGIVARQSYAESPPRVEYELTAKGRALLPIIDEMRRFGHEWLVPEHHHAAQPVRAQSAASARMLVTASPASSGSLQVSPRSSLA